MISIHNLSFGYKKNKPIFENLNLHLESGSIYGLLGKNGAGKSTLLYNMMGLVFPDSGRIDILGYEPKNRKPSFLSEVFFVPEEVALPAISVQKYLQLYTPFYPNFSETDFYNYLREFEISEAEKLNGMSHGEQKKMLIAFGLATNSRLLLMDEPTNGLDIPSKSKFRKLVASYITDEKLVIISTHQVRDLDNLIDQVIILKDNEVILNSSIEEISRKLSFGVFQNKSSDVLFGEETIGGKLGVMKNKTDDESKVNIEHLFGAAMNEPNVIKEIFSI
ncbi:MAG TPA: ABC transporter ATP-binding protein [Leadbetterella sp.]|nr:ABC transporter ATP-binding protein [Leadbetterella sp.]